MPPALVTTYAPLIWSSYLRVRLCHPDLISILWKIISVRPGACILWSDQGLAYSGSLNQTTRPGWASCRLWYAPGGECLWLVAILCKYGDPRIQTFLKGLFPGSSVVYGIVFPLWRTSYDLTQKILRRPNYHRHGSHLTKDLGLFPAINEIGPACQASACMGVTLQPPHMTNNYILVLQNQLFYVKAWRQEGKNLMLGFLQRNHYSYMNKMLQPQNYRHL